MSSPSLSSSNLPPSACLALRLATRAALLASDLLLSWYPPKANEAANMLLNASRKETPLCSVILIEQVAQHT